MEHISELSQGIMKDIKLIVFDVDGVLVPRGTKIKQDGNVTTLETKKIAPKQIGQIKKMHELGFEININSGRGLYMLQEMFRDILPYVSLTYENGSATWFKGNIHQHVNSFEHLNYLYPKLMPFVGHPDVKGFEPKEFIITLHCHEEVPEIEEIVTNDPKLYTKWNGEAYDVGVKDIQTKGIGVQGVAKVLGLTKENILAIGDNINDIELLENAGIGVTADKSRLKGDFWVPLEGELLPADMLMEQIISVLKPFSGTPSTG